MSEDLYDDLSDFLETLKQPKYVNQSEESSAQCSNSKRIGFVSEETPKFIPGSKKRICSVIELFLFRSMPHFTAIFSPCLF